MSKLGEFATVMTAERILVASLHRMGYQVEKARIIIRRRRFQVNDVPAPMQLRLLCELKLKAQSGFEPFAGEEFQPLVLSEPELAL